MNKKLIRLTESDLHRIIKESLNKIMSEGVEYQNDDPYDEIQHYMQLINDTYDELARLKVTGKNNDMLKKDINLLERYIKMMYAHVHQLQQSTTPMPTMAQVIDKPTPLIHY